MSQLVLKQRHACRLARSLAISKRRQKEHVARIGREGATTCACLSYNHFAKRSVFGCNCRKRSAGRPKVSVGMCDMGARQRIYTWRQEARELRVAVLMGRNIVETDDP